MIIEGKDHEALALLAHRIGMINMLLNGGYPAGMFRRVLETFKTNIDEVLALDFNDDDIIRASTGDRIAQEILRGSEIPDSPEGLTDGQD
jgi:hypothetical protein